jgi:putative chitinase
VNTSTIGGPFCTHIPAYEVDANPNRLAAFVAQCCHESGVFRYLREIWGPTALQSAYDTRADLGNSQPGEGFKFRGAGWIQVTGKYWFDKIGHELGLDLVGNPDQANDPNVATLMSLAWWKLTGMNAIADSGDVAAVTKRINPGLLGLDGRKTLTQRALEILHD